MKMIFPLAVLLSSAAALSGPVNRRTALIAAGLVTSSCAVVGEAAAASADAGETIRRGAANLPGYGPSDVFYPLTFKGKWHVVREIVDDTTVEYEMRFIQSGNDAVADRGFNQAALERALSSIETRSYEWTETNPNDLRLEMEDGSRKEIKVTKRASERTEDFVSSSEFQRVTTEDSRMGIPAISARRTSTKWKILTEASVEGLEIVNDMGGGGDPLAGATTAGPRLISKSRLHLKRIP